MVTFEEAGKIVTNAAKPLGIELIDTLSALGRVLAEDVVSDMDMPPFDKSAMDGYACRFEDLKNELEVLEIIPAGAVPQKKIEKNQCAKIMTGAMIPQGADCVIMIEHTEETNQGKVKYTKEIKEINVCQISPADKRMLNICYQGEDIQTGAVIIKKGKTIKPQHIAMLASVGYTKIQVYKLPRIAVIPTGNEIVEPHVKPAISEIRNSNGYQLIAQLKNIGIEAEYYGIARDTEKETINLIKQAIEKSDLIILTGGVSKGDFDLVPQILQKLEFKLLFEEISVQPGKPTVFGVKDNKFCFGLPGNPVSSFVQFELLVKTFINEQMGFKCTPFVIPFPISADYYRKNGSRTAFLPVNINKQGQAELVDYNGSAHINAYNMAWGIMEVPMGVKKILKGDKVHVRQI